METSLVESDPGNAGHRQHFLLLFSNGFILRKQTEDVSAPLPGSCPVTYHWSLFSCICISHIKGDNDWLRLSHLHVPDSITGVLLPNWPCLNHSGRHLDWQANRERDVVPGEREHCLADR